MNWFSWRARGGAALAVLLAGVLGLVFVRPGSAAAPARPNILLFVLDDARTGATEVMSKMEGWLRRDGTYFPNTVATTPSCCPSRASLLSGRFTHNHGVDQQGAIGRYDHTRTLQHDLDAAGYATAAVGKLFNQWPLRERPPGFDRWALTHGGYERAWFAVEGKSRRVGYSTAFIGEQVNRYVDGFEADDARPWFVYAGFTAPHSPYTPEDRYASRTFPWDGNPAVREKDRRDKPSWVRKYSVGFEEGRATRTAQLRTLLSVDDAVDSVRRHLSALGELDNTVVVLLSDNGKAWGEHGLPSKFTPYVESVNVPVYVWWPGHVAAGVTDPRLAALVDVTPTLQAAAGLRASYEVDGRSLFGPTRDQVLLEYRRDPANGSFPTWASLFSWGRYQYTEYYDGGGHRTEREYYDLAADPWQLTNLLADGGSPPAGVAEELAAQRRCAGVGCS